MKQHKLYPYFWQLITYIVGIVLLAISFKRLNIVTYLMLMIFPIFISSILFTISMRKQKKAVNGFSSSIIAAAIYFIFYVSVLYLAKQTNAMEFIYQNSKSMFTEGFSIGNKMQFSIGDAILPLALTFVVHYVCVVLAQKNKKTDDNIKGTLK